MEINKPTNFLKANVNIKNGDTVMLLNEGYWDKMTDATGKAKEVLKFEVQLPNGEIKGYTMNNSTIDNLTAAYGKDSRDWMNKPLKVWITMEVSFGKRKPVLRLTPMNWASPIVEEDIPVIEGDAPIEGPDEDADVPM